MTFKDILTNLDDQVLKGLVLKVKNECMKKDIQWSEVRVFLKNLKDYRGRKKIMYPPGYLAITRHHGVGEVL